MINPHGSDTLIPCYVTDDNERAALAEQARSLPAITVSSAAAANAVMLAGGYFTPLRGYMNLGDALQIAENMHTKGGLFWPIPILNICADPTALAGATRVALKDPNLNGNPVLAIQNIETIETATTTQLETITASIYRTLDRNHPGVAAFRAQGAHLIAGPIEVLNYSYFQREFPDTFHTAQQIRDAICDRQWQRVVAFQTRNPMHRAHEILCKIAMKAVSADGVLVHMLLGKLKPGDLPASVRDASIRAMVKHYFPPNTILIAGYGFDMLYAGPREAVLHALFRQNAGCTDFIIGRDHAGIGDYYGPFDSQTIFDDEIPDGALGIEIFRADHTAWSKKLNQVVMMRDAPDHTLDDFILISGTKLRQMLTDGLVPPPEITRPEVAKLLMAHYRNYVQGTSKS